MLKTYILPYNIGSASAKALSLALNIRRSKGEREFKPRSTVVNWGNGKIIPRGRGLRILNRPDAVATASNKLSTFRILQKLGVPTVEFTTSRREAEEWIDENTPVYARQKLTGSSGEGIVVLQYGDRFVDAPMYTKGFIKTHEYRVHVVDGKVIDFTKKRRREGTPEENSLIKNLENGWVFCRDNVKLPNKVRAASLAAVSGMGLDFGAVDILYSEKQDMARILEVNTAPGLEGTTLERYTEAIRRLLSL